MLAWPSRSKAMASSAALLGPALLGPKAVVAAAAGYSVEYSDGYFYFVTPAGAWSERYQTEAYAWHAAYRWHQVVAAEAVPA